MYCQVGELFEDGVGHSIIFVVGVKVPFQPPKFTRCEGLHSTDQYPVISPHHPVIFSKGSHFFPSFVAISYSRNRGWDDAPGDGNGNSDWINHEI